MEHVDLLVNEYRTLLTDGKDITALENALINDAEWTPRAAEHLIQLAKDYGSFMLKNAMAISLALEIEDGELGF